MADFITTIIIITTSPTSTLSDSSSKDGKQWQVFLDLVKEAPGVLSMFWGKQLESPENMILVIDHEQGFKLDYKATAELDGICSTDQPTGPLSHDTPIKTIRAQFNSSTRAALTSPTTEFSFAFFPVSTGTAELEAFEKSAVSVQQAVKDHLSSAKSHASGWLNDVQPIPNSSHGELGKAHLSIVGWESMEQHHAFNETKTFKDNVKNLATGGLAGWHFWHVKLTEVPMK